MRRCVPAPTSWPFTSTSAWWSTTPSASRAHVLNDSAARIWGMLQAPVSPDRSLAALAVETGRPEAELAPDVRTAIERFGAEGLLGEPPAVVPAHGLLDGWHRVDGGSGRVAAALEMLDRTVAVTSTSLALRETLDWFGLPARTRETPGEVYELELAPAELRTLPSRLNRLASASATFVVVHAAGVVFDDVVVALPAGPGAGKSTLATRLVADGAGYLTDEVLGVAAQGLAVTGYTKRITLEIGSWPLFPDLEGVASRAIREHLDPTRVRWLDPRDVNPHAFGWRGHPLRLGVIVVPRYLPGAAVEVEPLSALDTLAELLTDCFNLATMGEAGLTTLRDVATSVPAYRLVHGDARRAAESVRDLAVRHGASL